jgi:hypothetical protein
MVKKDSIGQELKVGDVVSFICSYTHRVCRGIGVQTKY